MPEPKPAPPLRLLDADSTIAAAILEELRLHSRYLRQLVRRESGRKKTAAPPSAVEAGFARVPAPPVSPPFRHTRDYREVHWHGMRFRFSKTQAAAVEALDVARKMGEVELPQEEVLERISSDSLRLSDLFRRGDGYRAWGLLIVPGSMGGMFRLADAPPDAPAS